MKKLVLVVFMGLITVSMAYAQGQGRGGGGCRNQCGAVAELPYQEVDAAEREDLLFMREEEKLARDVYRAFDDLWGMLVFRNISGAEQSHMNALLSLVEKYEIPDSVGTNDEGVFSNPQLQTLYDELIEQGSQSLIDGLVVGATIEDLDIHDLDTALGRTDNDDIRTVYQNLQKGSRNHLRAFIGLLEDSGVPYEPQYISVEDFEEIMSTPWERGCVDADGESQDCPSRVERRHRHQNRRTR